VNPCRSANRLAPPPVEEVVADRGDGVEDDADRGQRDLPAVQLLGPQLAGERRDLGERDRRPEGHQRDEGARQDPGPAQDPLGRARSQRQPRGRREDTRDHEPDRRRELEARVLADQHPRGRERVQPEESRGGDEGERDEEQPRVAPPPRRHADRVAERDVGRRRREHQPEVRRVVLPALVDRRVREHQHEHGRADDEHEQRPEGVRGAAAYRSICFHGSP
jgi:hypothetical protein